MKYEQRTHAFCVMLWFVFVIGLVKFGLLFVLLIYERRFGHERPSIVMSTARKIGFFFWRSFPPLKCTKCVAKIDPKAKNEAALQNQ